MDELITGDLPTPSGPLPGGIGVSSSNMPVTIFQDSRIAAWIDAKFEELAGLIGEGVEFEIADVQALSRPIVYVLSGPRGVLYVGLSRNGLERPFSPRHSVMKDVLQWASKLKIFPCKNLGDARKAESILIGLLQPIYNRQGRTALYRTG